MFVPKDWPFEGKPVTNSYITLTIGITAEIVWCAACVMWPAQVLLGTALVCLGLLVRSIYRRIRPEWT